MTFSSLDFTFVPNAAPTSWKSGNPTIEDVPQEIREQCEQIYNALKGQAGRMEVTFPTRNDLNQWVQFAKQYCELRPAGAIRLRVSPIKGATKTSTRLAFRITDLLTKEEETAKEIHEVTEAAKAAAKAEIDDETRAQVAKALPTKTHKR